MATSLEEDSTSTVRNSRDGQEKLIWTRIDRALNSVKSGLAELQTSEQTEYNEDKGWHIL